MAINKIVYICRRWKGEPKVLDGEMEELKFFSPYDIDISEISPPIRRVIVELLKRFN